MKRTIRLITTIFSCVIALCLLNACVNVKKMAYFSNLKRDSVMKIQPQMLQTLISKNDILSITISTLDETFTRQLNASGINGGIGGTSNAGYLVDETGVIKLPFLGVIKAEGLTKKQLSEMITNELLNRKLAKEPVVTVRIENYKITVWGEVSHPGIIPVPNEHMTLPEALAAAGDLSVYGNREDILLIRETDGQRIAKHINLNKGDIFDPEIYNLRNQDVIYVSPTKGRAQSIDRSAQTLSLALSAISIIILIYVQFIK